ncbi:hypothetical protein ACHAWF_005834 [Thalassiosira exigua]
MTRSRLRSTARRRAAAATDGPPAVRRRSRRSPAPSSFLLVLFLLAAVPSARAGWIDPDTPKSAYQTSPYKVVPAPPAPKENAKSKNEAESDDDDIKKKPAHRGRRRDPTASPTYYPTFEPTSLPSEAPSSETPAPTDPERIYDLVFSDEFDVPGRTFEDGADPRWTALEKNDYTNDAQHYYSHRNAYTSGGNLVIKSEAADTTVVGFDDATFEKERATKHFRSAMLQSWNKFCFAGGVLEAEIALPGRHDVGGLWPAFWLLGNLARHTYVGSSEHVWPWSSGVCTDKSRTAQLVSGCDRVQHYGMKSGVGRGAPEIDVFEVQAGSIKANTGPFLKMPVGQPFLSSSYQVAPGRLPRPGEGWWPAPGQWYDNLTGGINTSLNIAFYGTYNHFLDSTRPAEQDYWSDAISYNRQLNASHFGKHHRYRVEWELPDKNGTAENNFTETFGYIRWFLDDDFVLEVKGEGLNASGTGGEISTEPMYMLLNTAISSQWGSRTCAVRLEGFPTGRNLPRRAPRLGGGEARDPFPRVLSVPDCGTGTRPMTGVELWNGSVQMPPKAGASHSSTSGCIRRHFFPRRAPLSSASPEVAIEKDDSPLQTNFDSAFLCKFADFCLERRRNRSATAPTDNVAATASPNAERGPWFAPEFLTSSRPPKNAPPPPPVGFPQKCPAMCPCKTYNCRGGFTETCGFSEGFCDMLKKPAEYKINWVRVYQDKDDPKQKVGCSTKERPTRKFIEAHEKKYMQKGDVSSALTERRSSFVVSPSVFWAEFERARGPVAFPGMRFCDGIWTNGIGRGSRPGPRSLDLPTGTEQNRPWLLGPSAEADRGRRGQVLPVRAGGRGLASILRRPRPRRLRGRVQAARVSVPRELDRPALPEPRGAGRRRVGPAGDVGGLRVPGAEPEVRRAGVDPAGGVWDGGGAPRGAAGPGGSEGGEEGGGVRAGAVGA